MVPLKFTLLPNNPALDGMASWLRDVVYSAAAPGLTMQILIPWAASLPANAEKRWPAVVFVQGSAWTTPDVAYELPQLGQFARKGYVVATVTHRSALDGHKAPAFLQDVKTAIRFLRRGAAAYHVDPDRIGVWGTSSGGNAALLVGLTGDDPVYRTGEYAEYSDAVRTVVDCFGPADLAEVMRRGLSADASDQNRALMVALLGDDPAEQARRMAMMDPIRKVLPGRAYPPFLILHGDRDEMVSYGQSERMARILSENDVATELVRVEGAPHEGSFWSERLLELIAGYLARTL